MPPRDTHDAIRELERDVERNAERAAAELDRFAERLDTRLGMGSDKFTRMEIDLASAVETAEEAKKAASIKPIPWVRVVPIIITMLVLAGTIVAAMARAPTREEFDAYAEASDDRIAQLQEQITALKLDIVTARATADVLRGSMAEVIQTVGKAAPTTSRGKKR